MKNLTSIITTAICTLLLFSTVVYTSCRKDNNKCLQQICYNGGTCTNGICTCPTGFEGPRCETESDPCKGVVCQNGGACGLGGQCFCPYGYAGKYCEIKKCDTATCLNGATCQDGTCICADGYEGTHCETAFREKFIGKWINAYLPSDTITITDCGNTNAAVACAIMNFPNTPKLSLIGAVEPARITFSGHFQLSGGYEISKLKFRFNGNHMSASYHMVDLSVGSLGEGVSEYVKL